MSKTKKHGAGRPPIDFDLSVVEGLGRIGATINDMVHVLPASKRTLAERMADFDGDFRIAYEKGRALLNSSLRRKQIAVAMAGNVTMLTWLGKQHLAQHDRVEVDTVGLDATLDKFIAAGAKAREAGDQAGVQSVLAAIDRIRDGESAEMVYCKTSPCPVFPRLTRFAIVVSERRPRDGRAGTRVRASTGFASASGQGNSGS